MEEEKRRSEQARKNANKRYGKKQSQLPDSESESKSERGSADGSATCTADRTASRAHQMPDDFRPTDAHVQLAAELGVDLEASFQGFTDYHLSKGSTFKDWNRALNTWLRNDMKFTGFSNGNRKPSITEIIERERQFVRAQAN